MEEEKVAVMEAVEEAGVKKEMDSTVANLEAAGREWEEWDLEAVGEVVMEEVDLEVKVEEHRLVDKGEEKEEMVEEVLEEEVKVRD